MDGTYEAAEEGGEPVYISLGDDQLNQIRRVVQTAVGLNSSRGDVIEVVNMQFTGGPQVSAEPGGQGTPGWLGLATEYGGRFLLFLIAAGMLVGVKKNLGRLVTDSFRGGGGPAGEARAESGAGGRLGRGPDNSRHMAEEVKEYAGEHPEKVAEVLQTWLAEKE